MTTNDLIGMKFDDARKALGHWWVLEAQHDEGYAKHVYFFERAGKGRCELHTEWQVPGSYEQFVTSVWPKNKIID